MEDFIKTIVLEFNEKKLELTVEQAMKLRDELNNLFSVRRIEYVPYIPVNPPYMPCIWYGAQIGDSYTLTWSASEGG